MTRIDDFWEWAERELEASGLTWYRVEMMAGLSNAAISKRAREYLPPTHSTCRAIAHAFHVPTEEVFRRAGLLPPEPPETALTREALHLLTSLPTEDQERALAILRALAERERIAVREAA